ncbi:hypothetical protein [Reichenbachiella sp. MALMAid0571]|uniref:hypothetical protein n=1 Tax=Reichenbachiella sp. MALMAid0571 TaxID=3143939 RepID=UPI0032DE2D18
MTNSIKFLGIMCLMLLISFGATAQQDTKALTKEIKDKAVKEARKEAKSYAKDGWYTQPGSLPMDKQIEKAWMKQYEEDENGYPKYYVGTGNSVAGAQSAAKLQASTIAKQDLAGRISSSIASIIETNIANEQISAEDAVTIQQTVSASTEIIAQKLGRVVTLTELYRKVGSKNIEANIRIAYSQELAMDEAKKVIKKDLEEKTNVAREKLDKLMNF